VRIHGNVSQGKDLTVHQVRRGNGEDAEVFQVEVDRIVCRHSETHLQREELCGRLKPFLNAITNGRGTSFTLAEGDDLLTILGISKLKRDSREKSDIYLNLEDPLTGSTGWQGYTVKALLGSKPTLFNASEPTNFLFRVDPPLTVELINHYNETDSSGRMVHGLRDTIADLITSGHTLEFVDVDERFRENLELLDSEMPEFLSEALIAYYGRKTGKATSVLAITDALVESNPLQVRNPEIRYSHKIKDFLEASAYGMVPTETYAGERTASGGLLLVDKSGQITCFRLDDKDGSRDYLLEHTYFETASRRKHDFGVLENHGDKTLIKLNLQIRYK
jgi:type II restriction enzyme